MPPTGPKSATGKAKVSRNAVKHGLLTVAPVVDGMEQQEEWDRHLAGYIEGFQPEGYVETQLVERIAAFAWRLTRAVRYETYMITVRLNEIPDQLKTIAGYRKFALGRPVEETYTEEVIKDQISMRMLPDKDALATIIRYEAHLHRQMIQTIHELEAMQARRRGESTPLARLDISGPPGG